MDAISAHAGSDSGGVGGRFHRPSHRFNPKGSCSQCVGMLWRKCDEGDVCDVVSPRLSDSLTRQQSPDMSDVCVLPRPRSNKTHHPSWFHHTGTSGGSQCVSQTRADPIPPSQTGHVPRAALFLVLDSLPWFTFGTDVGTRDAHFDAVLLHFHLVAWARSDTGAVVHYEII